MYPPISVLQLYPFYDKLDKLLSREQQPCFFTWLYPTKYPEWEELTNERLTILLEKVEVLVEEYLKKS